MSRGIEGGDEAKPATPCDAIVARARETLADLLDVDLRARGEAWDVAGRETLEGRPRRVKDAIPKEVSPCPAT